MSVPPADDVVGRRCLVSGRVQGVFFRAATRDRARELGVNGTARNLPDGRVEVICVGSPRAVDALCDWLRDGPPDARVAHVECASIAPPAATAGFSIA